MVTKKSLSGKTQGIWKFYQSTGNLVCSSCKFPDSKGKRYFYICCENSQFFFEAGYVYQVSLVYVIVTNHVNWHRGNLQSDRENTGSLYDEVDLPPPPPAPPPPPPETSQDIHSQIPDSCVAMYVAFNTSPPCT